MQRSDAHYLAAVKNFETAVHQIQKQNYEKAEEILEKLAAGPVRELAARARVHLRLCEQRLSRATATPKTAEDCYNQGVIALNARKLDQAMEHLGKADKLAPDQEHIRYVLAAVHARLGNPEAALEHLKAAITLRPENRFRARRDEDFASLTNDLRFKRLTSLATSQDS